MDQNYGENSSQTEQNQFDGKEQYSGGQPSAGSQAGDYANDSQPASGYQPGDGSLTGAYPADNSNQENGYRQDNNNWNNGYQQDNNNWNNGYQQDNRNGNNGWQQGSGNYQQGNSYQNTGYMDNNYQSYHNNYPPYGSVPPYGNDQLELEEPVKISEWVLALVLMMIPCVNIIMMFVWAFSSSEKKSKSNFFKAYLIFFGISMAVVLLIWILIVWFVLLVG